MNRRERIEARIERRQEWAAAAEKEQGARFGAAKSIADGIPFGQPILVGHHSEKHARRDQERIWTNMRKGVDAGKRAERHESVAESLERSLGKSIFSDDDDAPEALRARIAEREAELARINAINKAARAGKLESIDPPLSNEEIKQLDSCQRFAPCWSGKPGFPPYHASNLRGRITADRKRLKDVECRQSRHEQAVERGGLFIERSGDWCSVCFAEKPAQDVINDLRASDFRWSGGAWFGAVAKVPDSVREMESKGGDNMIGTWSRPGWSSETVLQQPEKPREPKWIQAIEQGTILVYSWGHEQTQVEFLVVTQPRTGSFVWVAGIEIGNPEALNSPEMCARVVPALPAVPKEQPVKRKVTVSADGESIKMPHGIAVPWDGQAKLKSWYG
jgi:hypothetical protein